MIELALIVSILVAIYYKFIKANPDDDFMKELMIKQTQFTDKLEIDADLEIIACDVTILYSTQTGNALYYAKKLFDLVKSYNLSGQIINVAKLDLEKQISCKLFIFVMSTFGDGDPADDAVVFFKNLKIESENKFSHCPCVILGLGSSTYPRFNQAAKLLKKCIGKPLLYMEMDETKSLEMEFHHFTLQFELFLIEFGKSLGYPMDKTIKNINVIYNSVAENVLLGLDVHDLIVDRSHPKLLAIQSINKVFESDRVCYHIEFDNNKQDPQLNWEYGDHIAIYPQNSKSKLMEVCNYFNLQETMDTKTISVIHGPTLIDSDIELNGNLLTCRSKLDSVVVWENEAPKTLRTLFRNYIDLESPVPLLLIEKLKALGYCTAINDEFYKSQIFTKRIALMDFIKLFKVPSTTAVLNCILLYMSRISARWYSITSSDRLGDSISICVVTVSYTIEQPEELNGLEVIKTKNKAVKGLCTDYLTRCCTFLSETKLPCIVPVFLRKSNFKIPKYAVPMLWVGPGSLNSFRNRCSTI